MKYSIAALAVALCSLQAFAGPADRPKEELIKGTEVYIKAAATNIVKYEDVPTPLAGFVKSIEKLDNGSYGAEVTAGFYRTLGVGALKPNRGPNDPALLCVFSKSDAKKLELEQRINFTAAAKQVSSFQERWGNEIKTIRAVVAACAL